MPRTRLDVTVNRSSEDVFAFVMDFENNPKWLSMAQEARWLDDGETRPGRRARQVSRILGKRMEVVAEIVDWHPPRWASYRTVEGPVNMRAEWRVEPHDGGCRLIVEADWHGVGGLFGSISDPILTNIVVRQMQTDLANLKEVLELNAETEELYDRLAEVRASRQRLVVAQDAARRRIERDLHDGAQQQLVAIKIKLGIARTLAAREAAPGTVALLEQLSVDTDDAVDSLRSLAHGIYPPLLASDGLPAALRAAAGKASLPVTITEDGITRYHEDLEAAIYFCCLEALQNISKYASASKVIIRLKATTDTVTFTIVDDGIGFDPATTPPGAGLRNMTDRLDALGGALNITSSPQAGTTITGRLPTHPLGGDIASDEHRPSI